MDIVEQLRSNADERLAVWQVVKTMNEAADEIERLREVLKKIYWATKEPEIDRIAGAALQQKDK